LLAAVEPVRHPFAEPGNATGHFVGVAYDGPLNLRPQKSTNGMAIPHGMNGQSLEICVISPRDRNRRQIFSHVISGRFSPLPTTASAAKRAYAAANGKRQAS
jgi:hypothetical protein